MSYFRFRFGFGFGSSDFGTATSRRVNSFMRSKADGSDFPAGALGAGVDFSAFMLPSHWESCL
jgi:hypothetical protein